MLKVSNLSFSYGNKKILDDISFTCNDNELTGIIGSNGCGKTTLINSIASILNADGSILLDEIDLTKLKAKQISNLISYIPQTSSIDIDVSVLDVVLMAYNNKLNMFDNYSAQMIKDAKSILNTFEIFEYDENFQHLSLGQKQQCIFARALLNKPKLLLFDEPESALDFNHRYKMMDTIKNIIKQNNALGFIALHDIQLALNCCDKLLIMEDQKIIDEINPKIDDIKKMEESLSLIYEDVLLTRIIDSGKYNLVLIKR